MKRFTSVSFVIAGLFAASAFAQGQPAQKPAAPEAAAAAAPQTPAAPRAASLDELLDRVRSSWRSESSESKRREQEFLGARDKQQQLLKQAQAELVSEENRGQKLELEFENNENRIAELEETLRQRLGTMGEMFGVVRTVAGETRNQLRESIISSQYPGRDASLAHLADSKELPSIDELEQLWFVMMQQMAESGKVVSYQAQVVNAEGTEGQAPVVRVGGFNASSGGRFVRWNSEIGKLVELGRQPPDIYVSAAENLEETEEGIVKGPVDPSRGQLLALLIQTPDFLEHLTFGGMIGYITIALGVLAFLGALVRLAQLSIIGSKVKRQANDKTPRKDNPLGRVLMVYQGSKDLDTDTLERKLDEAVVSESSQLERFLWAIKLTSVVAPLLGLLGTVTGMIKTFQVITLFGAGDPKLMASGISEALVTTEIGLMVAIPLTLLHGWLASSSKRVTEIITEQSAGLVAQRAEQERRSAAAS